MPAEAARRRLKRKKEITVEYNQPVSPEVLEEIERYLMERMSPDEALAFEQRMRTDEELRSRVEELRLVMLGISQSLLRSKLDEFHTLVPGQDQKPAVRRSSGFQDPLRYTLIKERTGGID